MKSRINISLLIGVCLMSLVYIPEGSAGDNLADEIVIKSLNAFHLEPELNKPILKVVLTFSNNSFRYVRIKDGRFKVYLNLDNKDYESATKHNLKPLTQMDIDLIGNDKENLNQNLYIGQTDIAIGDMPHSGNVVTNVEYIEIPAKSTLKKIVEIRMPESIEDRIRTIYLLINYLGFPKASKTLSLMGSASISIKDKTKGWSIKYNLKREFNLRPQIEKKGILF